MNSKRGMFVCLEGLDGSGKSTQVELLKQSLEAQGREVVLTRAPGGTELGQKLRDIVLGHQDTISEATEIALLLGDHYQRVEEVIMPALDRGAVVIADRYIDSTYAYQSFGKGISKLYIDNVRDALGTLPEPDIRFYIRVEAETAMARTAARKCDDHNVFDDAKLDFRRKVMAGFDERFLKQDDSAIVVDGEAVVADIHTAIMGHFSARLNTLPTAPHVDYGTDELACEVYRQLMPRAERKAFHLDHIRSITTLLSTDPSGEITQGYLAGLSWHAKHMLADILVDNTNWSMGGLQRRYGDVLLSQVVEIDGSDISEQLTPHLQAFFEEGKTEVKGQEVYVFGRHFVAFRASTTAQMKSGSVVKKGDLLPIEGRHPNFTDLAVHQGLRRK